MPSTYELAGKERAMSSGHCRSSSLTLEGARALAAAVAVVLCPAIAAAQDVTVSHEWALTSGPHPSPLWALADTTRPRSIEVGPGYYTRLQIHRIGSFAALPLFAGEYLLGERLLDDDQDEAGWVKPAHTGVAVALGGLFVTNTVTGVWNLWESRRVPEGRTRRLLHTALMLAADGGFVYTATLAHDASRSESGGRRHRNAAIASISAATVSTVMMWLWKG
jgi:hypothetical protein